MFKQGGNAFGAPARLGNTENQPLDILVNNGRVMRYEPGGAFPNLIGGGVQNSVTPGVLGAFIGRGSQNTVTDVLGTIAGGVPEHG